MVNRAKLFLMVILALLLPLSVFSATAFFEQEEAKKAYVCPPCGCGADERVYDKAGFCTACAMELAEKGGAAARSHTHTAARRRAAILIFEGVQIIDYSGPYEVFGQAGFDTFTVAKTTAPITTAMGMRVTPNYDLKSCPQPNVLVIPGGGVTETQNDAEIIKWIQEQAAGAEHVLSVCNGAFILAKTGLLDGLSATTFYRFLDGFNAVAPKTKVVYDQRYVDNGKIITTAGISSGIDGSLYVISKINGKARAQLVALNMEYNWQPDSKYARGSFADMQLFDTFPRGYRFEVPAGVSLRLIHTQGGADNWEIQWQVEGASSPADILKAINNHLAANDNWSRLDRARPSATGSAWKFTDKRGVVWNGSVSLQSVETDKQLRLALKIVRSQPTASRAATTNKGEEKVNPANQK